MATSNKLMPILLKASLLATVLFWTFEISSGNYNNISPFIIFSIIPAFILCSFTIIITIMPFIWSEKNGRNRTEIFKKYFPYYSIIASGVCSYYIILSNFDDSVCSFMLTIFLTLMQSWVWICKKNTIRTSHKNDFKNISNDKI
tara:strand:- start:71 stop:502 length:432 start_codon:yes stop_codon:yes gene_type:complete